MLLIPLSTYFVLAILYLFAVPIGESPDEPGHLQCIEQVSMLGQLPQIEPKPQWDNGWWSRGVIISGRMCYHMPLYYLVAGGVQKVVATTFAEEIDFEFPPTSQDFGPNLSMFDHSVKATFWEVFEPNHLVAVRLFSILLGGIVVWVSGLVARRLFPEQPLVGLLAGYLTAVWPQFVYLSRSLNNDGLATALAAMLLAVLLNVGRPQRFIFASLLAIFALFTKISVAFTVVAVLLIWGLEYWKFPSARRQYRRYLLICLALFGSAFLLLYFTPTLWQHFSQASGAFSSPNEAARQWSYWQDVFELTVSSGWVRFGWMNVAAPQWHAYVWWACLLGTAVLGFIAIFRFKKQLTIRLQLAIILVWLMLISLSYFQINLNRLQPQFRFALAAIPVLTALSAVGWWHVVRGNGRVYIIGTVITAMTLLFYNVWVIVAIINPAYQWW